MHYEVIPDSEEERQRYVQGLSVVIPILTPEDY